jgi:CheY-like chemotaxis protein
MKILVVDDEPHIVMLIKSRLIANNYEVITANDGQECLKKLVDEKPDLLILDIMMPKMDGYSVLVAIKEMREMTGDIPEIPVIILTARVEARIKELVEQEQIQAYLVKPFDSKELLKTIETFKDKSS